jgi:CubicO group peptidase (beta-lactamase class C family)
MRSASRSLQLLLALLALLALQSLAPAQAVDEAAVDALVAEALKAWHAPGAAVAIVRDDKVVYLKGHGVKELGSEQPVTPDTQFAIASTSKAFTATAIAMLVDEGKMAWDDPVRKYLDYFRLADPLADANVTLRDLVCHRTGLSRHDLLWYGAANSREEILRRIGFVKLDRPFRSTFQYQNIMFLAAGQAAGAADKSSWETVVQKRIFDPLGMTGANFSVRVAAKAPDHATPHVRLSGKTRPIPWKNIDNVGPAGSINASARDLTRWVRFQLGDGVFEGKRLLSAARLAETHAPQMVIDMDGPTGVPSYARAANPETNVMSYGMGWVIQDFRGQHLLSHGGSIDGFRAQVALVPKAKLGIVILSNLGRTSLPEALRNSLVELLLDLPKRDWNALYLEQTKKRLEEDRAKQKEREAKRAKGTKPSRELTAYAGTFDDPAYGPVTLMVEKEALLLKWSSHSVRLEHFHYDTFTGKDAAEDSLDNPLANVTVTFTLDADGQVAALNMLGVEFKRPKAN